MSHRLTKASPYTLLVGSLLALGLVLRIHQYLFNRSLWLDEAKLAHNILHRSWPGLLESLGSSQGAPIGFLIVEKFLTVVFGPGEYALRLFPLLCSILSLFLFCTLAVRALPSRAAVWAVLLFAVSDRLIYYASDVKQYAVDVAVALLLTLAGLEISSRRLTLSMGLGFALLGAVALWFSHAAVFVLAGVGVSLFFFCFALNDRSSIIRLMVIFGVWIVSFGVSYSVSLADLTRHTPILNYWTSSFMPLPPTSLVDLEWFGRTFFRFLRDPMALPMRGLVAFIFLVGFVSLFLEKRKMWVLLISPVPFHLIASGLQKYPFGGRILLYLVPASLLLIAHGLEKIRALVSGSHVLRSGCAAVLIIIFFYGPLTSAAHHLVDPRTVEELKPVLKYAREHWKEGDVLYVYHGAKRAFQYYAHRYGFGNDDVIMGLSARFSTERYIGDLERLKGLGRVWILFSHVLTWKGTDEGSLFLDYLENSGVRLDSLSADGAAVYLYDIS